MTRAVTSDNDESAEAAGGARGLGLSLVGYRGTGKTTTARLLAGRRGLECADADAEIEARRGRAVRDVFRELGEPAFRDLEERVIADLTSRPLVLATGGGAILRASNRAALRRFGLVVWLTATPATIALRLNADPRGLDDRPALTPLGTIEEIEHVLAARLNLYQDAADFEVATDGLTAEQVADRVANECDARAARVGVATAAPARSRAVR